MTVVAVVVSWADGGGALLAPERWTVVDLFSGAGGMSYGFHAHPSFTVVGAADAQIGKPSTGRGQLGCNLTYRSNIGIDPVAADLSSARPADVCDAMDLQGPGPVVLCACPPCTGFSRTLARNHLEDDARNSLVGRVASYVEILRPQIVLMENARELVMGRFSGHLRGLAEDLDRLGYAITARTHLLDEFGLPQRRERALVVAARRPLPPLGLTDLWSGYRVSRKATHVRHAIWDLPPVEAGAPNPSDPMHIAPSLTEINRRRLAAIPRDGGGWADLITHPPSAALLTPTMAQRARLGKLGSHPDVYGRLWWDRPSVTIKRECGHIGNGRYSHPEQDRLCTVRELSILQGFPRDYQFTGATANMYRHIGDAVPPLISYQLAALCRRILTGERPALPQMLLPGGQLGIEDIEIRAEPPAQSRAVSARWPLR